MSDEISEAQGPRIDWELEFRRQQSRDAYQWKKSGEQVVFWQGKFSMLKDENNALRKENARLKKEIDRYESRDESMVMNDE